jgi:hypothetical protein
MSVVGGGGGDGDGDLLLLQRLSLLANSVLRHNAILLSFWDHVFHL